MEYLVLMLGLWGRIMQQCEEESKMKDDAIWLIKLDINIYGLSALFVRMSGIYIPIHP